MSKARENSDYTGLAADIAAGDTAARAGRKNLILNGGFDVWQRGTSFTNNNSVLFAADRYATFSNGASTISQQAFTLGQTDVASNPQYYLRWDVSTYASGDRVYQKIEDVITTSGQSVTLSYWAKAETATTMVPQATQAFGSGGSTAVTTAIDSVALTTSWQKFTRTFTLPSVSGKTIGAGSFLEVGLLRFTTSYTGYVDIANVQLELGSVATDFEHRSYGEELALCQRYYERFTADASAEQLIGIALVYNTTSSFINYPYKQIKRVIPSFTSSGASHFERLTGTWDAGTSISCQANLATARFNMAGFAASTSWTATEVRITTAANGAHWFAFDAEL